MIEHSERRSELVTPELQQAKIVTAQRRCNYPVITGNYNYSNYDSNYTPSYRDGGDSAYDDIDESDGDGAYDDIDESDGDGAYSD